ncbi:hypothetical protein HII31_12140 [Pseudocercospora fuligena]|uniref:Uncharacterized protein n=1 Tax=Pseudocercospora fuligena TaxID=685502 RepID=A0A8H6VDH6_9PEZI|nr:hypothetical protein HII31_12140 [Pseudocercospora fuligena]
MALSFLQAPHPPKLHQADKDLTIYENNTSSVQYHSKGSKYMMTHTIPPTDPKEAHLFFGLDTKPSVVLSSNPGSKTSATLGPKRYHRFENASKTETLKINIQLDPEDYENEQRFFRNFFGYLNDCKRAKVSPSIFQLFVFLHSADTPLAIPLPGFIPGAEFIGVYLSWVLLIAVAYVGRFVLGYKQSYPEYYSGVEGR